MAKGLSAILPIHRDPRNGYGLHQSFVPMIMQNLKMLLLTNPGERWMDPDFGVGIKTYLFEPDTPVTYATIRAKIVSQVKDYMDFLDIINVEFDSQGMGNSAIAPNYVNIKIIFNILPLNSTQEMNVKVNQ